MGWRGFVRTAIAASRAAERESIRRQKQALRLEMMDASADAVTEWEVYLDRIKGLHQEAGAKVDWQAILNSAQPDSPARSTERSDALRLRLEQFRPSMFHIFRGGAVRLQKRLQKQFLLSVEEEERVYRSALSEYEKNYAEWAADREMALGVIEGDPQAIKKALNEFQSLSDNELLGHAIAFEITKDGVNAVVDVHRDDVVPKFRRKQLASGRLSETKMPVAEFQERYQDYVCSAAFKVAGDLFNLLPMNVFVVTCRAELLNSSTGHVEPTPILSVKFVRCSWERLNLSALDPSEALANFNHAMSFKRSKGFGRIQPIEI